MDVQEPQSIHSSEMAHVLFMDIVAYTTLPTGQQQRLLEELNEAVRNTPEFIRAQAEDQLVRLPTGDGMALVFFRDPEGPVRCALQLSGALREHPEIKLRMGIHTGPVYRVADINANLNVAGGGINIAQRVMDCGDPGHILVSKATADVLREVGGWADSLQDLGEVKVKHGLRLHLFELSKEEAGRQERRKRLRVIRARRTRRALATTLVVLVVAGVAGSAFWAWHSLVFRSSRNTPISSIAVLPFANASNNSEMDYLGEGMSEEITNSLSRLPNLTVMARSTVSRYKSRQDDPQSFGRDLHVDAVLTGRVAEHGSDLTVEAELVDVASGAQLWGERYTRSVNDASLLQTAITSDVASRLTPQITRSERDKVARAGTRDGEAYQLYLKGRYHASKSTPEGLKKGIEYFQQAIEKDPSDALAYAGLADSYVRLGGGFGYALENDVFPKAEAAAIKALEIDDTLVEAHAAFGSVKALYKWDWTGAETEFKRAITLDPRNANAHNRYAQLLTWTGRFSEGITENKRAQDLDPLSPMIAGDLGFDYMVARRYDDSILQCKKAIDLEPSAMWLHAYLAWAYARKGDYAQAISEHEKLGLQGQEVSAENQLTVSGLGWIYAVAGRRRDAERVIEQFNSISSAATVDPYWVAAVYAGLGDKDRAFELLEKSYRQHSANLAYIKPDPFWDNLHSDSRYPDLLHRMGLPQ